MLNLLKSKFNVNTMLSYYIADGLELEVVMSIFFKLRYLHVNILLEVSGLIKSLCNLYCLSFFT